MERPGTIDFAMSFGSSFSKSATRRAELAPFFAPIDSWFCCARAANGRRPYPSATCALAARNFLRCMSRHVDFVEDLVQERFLFFLRVGYAVRADRFPA